jgi:hypothetical protein
MGGACVAWLPAAAVQMNVAALQWLCFAFIRFLKKVEWLQQQDILCTWMLLVTAPGPPHTTMLDGIIMTLDA